MGKKIIRIVFATLFLIIICLIGLYEVHRSYNNIKTTNYNITTNKINNSANLVIISDLHDNQLGEKNVELINQINSNNIASYHYKYSNYIININYFFLL